MAVVVGVVDVWIACLVDNDELEVVVGVVEAAVVVVVMVDVDVDDDVDADVASDAVDLTVIF